MPGDRRTASAPRVRRRARDRAARRRTFAPGAPGEAAPRTDRPAKRRRRVRIGVRVGARVQRHRATRVPALAGRDPCPSSARRRARGHADAPPRLPTSVRGRAAAPVPRRPHHPRRRDVRRHHAASLDPRARRRRRADRPDPGSGRSLRHVGGEPRRTDRVGRRRAGRAATAGPRRRPGHDRRLAGAGPGAPPVGPRAPRPAAARRRRRVRARRPRGPRPADLGTRRAHDGRTSRRTSRHAACHRRGAPTASRTCSRRPSGSRPRRSTGSG